MANPVAQPSVSQTNDAARALVLSNAVNEIQSIYSGTISAPGSQANVVNIAPRNVGLIKKFYVEVKATITNTSATQTLALTAWNVANILSNIQFVDLQNNVRINTAGWHLALINTAKGRRTFGAAFSSDSPIFKGANFSSLIISAAASIAATSSTVVQMLYEVPLAYSGDILKGAIYANIVNATMNLQLTINPNPVVAATVDGTLAVYQGTSAAGSISSVNINVYQEYLDQLPIGKNGPILPVLDLSTIYELKSTNLSGLISGADFPVPYANFRDFLSTSFIYDNGGTLNNGTDINYIGIQSANLSYLQKTDTNLVAFMARQQMQQDLPSGSYYISHRPTDNRKPLSTIQYGNMELIVNPSTVNSNASLYLGFEDFALINSITGAGSLAAG